MNILETFFILFETDAKRAQAEVQGAVDGMAAATVGADAKMAASGAAQTASRVGGAAKVVGAQVAVAEAETGVAAAVQGRAVVEGAQTAARLGQSRAVIAATNAETNATRLAEAAGERLGSTIGSLVGKFGLLIGSGLSLVGVLGTIRKSFADINALTEQADRLGFGENVEGLNAANQVLEDYGGNAEKAQRNLRRFSDSIAEAYGDAESAAGKALAGIGVNAADANGDLKDTEQVMLDIASALEGVGKKKQIATLKDLGLNDPSLRDLLTGGRQNIADRFGAERSKGLITNEQARQVREYKMAWDDAKDAVSGFFNTLAGNWAPGLTKFANRLEAFVHWLRENKTLVQGFGIGVTIALTTIAGVLWGTYIPAWTAAAVATIAATWPILALVAAVGAAIAVFALLWDDVQAFLKGQPSLIGDLVERYGWVRDVVEGIGTAFRVLKDWAGDAWGFISRVGTAAFDAVWSVAGPVLSLIGDGLKLAGNLAGTSLRLIWAVVQEVFGAIWPYVQPIFALITAAVEAIGGIFANVAKAIWGEWGAMFDRFAERVRFVTGLVRGLMGMAENARQGLERATPAIAQRSGAVAATVARGQVQLGLARANPLAAVSAGAVANRAPAQVSRSMEVKVGEVNVHTQATDADGMARAASGALSSQIRRATSHFDDGLDR